MIDHWMDKYAGERSNINPADIPWAALRSLLGESIYGGKVDNEFDRRLLRSLLGKIFVGESFSKEFELVAGVNEVQNVRGSGYDDFMEWCGHLDTGEGQNPSWMGLQRNADVLLATTAGLKMVKEEKCNNKEQWVTDRLNVFLGWETG
eukprot:TRINITY_DN3177_c0_g1_i3.p1 TRINITY_DN3177_c0_g1~~TRINITY_DN3177_c0_g1_i3.p1  ORF type:complete len:148 (-),score=35.82 TRINITY_DN3177_c0_g1_i3:3-446(-)